jgi:valyl-tRNA synthetase
VRQEEDVLDTWFSSALWPFATLGWPENTDKLRKFYPTTVLSTARDIIYLWVARMIMMGYEFMGDAPFSDVIIHPTVMAADGRRMSKSLGTGVDPLELIADYGTDATRFGLAYMSSVQDVRFSSERIEMGRNFANKIWNASRLILQGTDPEAQPEVSLNTPADRWIFSRLAAATQEATALYEAYEFDDVARLLYRFVWNEVCDWYLEVAKSRLYGEDAAARRAVSGNLLVLLERIMTLLHPLMPFVTEEIWSFLPQVRSGARSASLFDSQWLEADPSWQNAGAEVAMEAFTAAVAGLRSAREELGLARDLVGQVVVVEIDPGAADGVAGLGEAFKRMCNCEVAGIVRAGQEPAGRYATIEAPGVKVLLDLAGLVDVERERERLLSKAKKAQVEAAKARGKLGNQGFLAKAPEAVVAEERERLAAAESIIEDVKRQYRERVGEEMPQPDGTQT